MALDKFFRTNIATENKKGLELNWTLQLLFNGDVKLLGKAHVPQRKQQRLH
jgi:hypothetical protein